MKLYVQRKGTKYRIVKKRLWWYTPVEYRYEEVGFDEPCLSRIPIVYDSQEQVCNALDELLEMGCAKELDRRKNRGWKVISSEFDTKKHRVGTSIASPEQILR